MILPREHHSRFFSVTVFSLPMTSLCSGHNFSLLGTNFTLLWPRGHHEHSPIFSTAYQKNEASVLDLVIHIYALQKMSCHRIPSPSWIVSLLFPTKEITICKGTLSKGGREFAVICKLHLRRTENLSQHKANSRVSCQNRATFNIHASIQDASLHNVYCSHQIHMFST